MFRVSVTKSFTFDAAHSLTDYKGLCANLHGHTYKCEVTISGVRDKKSGMIIDFKNLKAIINETVMMKFDHQHINDKVTYNPTAENMVVDIANMFIGNLQEDLTLRKVKLWETPDSSATWEHMDFERRHNEE